jgi:hypothetical protein
MDKYRNFGWKPKYNFGYSQNITLTKSKYNLRSKYNRTSEPAPLTLNSPFTVFEKSGFQKPEQWWIFILYIKNTYRLQIYF